MSYLPNPYEFDYPGDYHGVPHLTYTPHEDALPDPGEVVWTWVPYEEDYTQGKDRPVLIVAIDGPWLLGLMLTRQDHDQEAREGRFWVEIGTGPWDPQHRVSEVRVNRIVRVYADDVRRIGGRVSLDVFHLVARGISQHPPG